MTQQSTDRRSWPNLPYPAWREACATLHLWTQIVGKIPPSQTPWLNHSWHVTLYVTARGLTTSPIPYGERTFQIDFDFIEHAVCIETSDGPRWQMPLRAHSVADFHAAVMSALSDVGIEVHIDEIPNELPDPIRFSQDRVHVAYDAEYAQRFWRVLLQADRMFKAFHPSFIGKCSPVHFFWGSFDLAVTRFSGRRAPRHPGGVPNLSDEVACEAYSHEVSGAGFWPGGGGINYRAFYSYAYPMPEGFRSAPVRPEAASFSHCASSCYPTMRCEQPRRRTRHSWTSCKAPMRPRPMRANGTGPRSPRMRAGNAGCAACNFIAPERLDGSKIPPRPGGSPQANTPADRRIALAGL
jgi:hypothetical protein